VALALGRSANAAIGVDVKVQGFLGADGGEDGVEATHGHVEDDVFANGIRVPEIVLGQGGTVGLEVNAAYESSAVVAEE
jgi:hypothetical protein